MAFANLIESFKATLLIALIYFLLVLVERFFIYRKIEFEKFGQFILITAVLVIPVAFLYTSLANYQGKGVLLFMLPIAIALIAASILAFSGLLDYMFKTSGMLKPTPGLKIMYIGFHLAAAFLYNLLKT